MIARVTIVQVTGHGGRRHVELQQRDLLFFRGLLEARVMSVGHAADIHFDGKAEAAKKRIQKLKAAGYVGERKRRAYEPSVLFLTRKAHDALAERGLLDGFPQLGHAGFERRVSVSDLTLRHELAVMDVKAAFARAVRENPALSLVEFGTWPKLHEFFACPSPHHPEVLVKPDGFIRLQEKVKGEVWEHMFFLEVDRSTETLDRLATRAACYLDYYKSGGLAEKFGQPRSKYKDFPFRVLMVFKTAERRDHVARRLLENDPPILTLTWLTTSEEVDQSPPGPIWVCPADYRQVVHGDSRSRPGRPSPADDFRKNGLKKRGLLSD